MDQPGTENIVRASFLLHCPDFNGSDPFTAGQTGATVSAANAQDGVAITTASATNAVRRIFAFPMNKMNRHPLRQIMVAGMEKYEYHMGLLAGSINRRNLTGILNCQPHVAVPKYAIAIDCIL